MKILKKILKSNPVLKKAALAVLKFLLSLKLYIETSSRLNRLDQKNKYIFYLGIPAHRNLGDLAQGVCIRHWLKKHYADYQVVEIETNALVDTPFSLLNKLVRLYKPGDMIVYQSGYTTTDLGGSADEMHRAVMKVLPNADMLMLPQTIYFKNEENKKRTSICYNSMRHMLFLARDRVSYDMAKQMFPDIPVMPFPDIVTTMIGKYDFSYERDGIMFCCRDDGEKYYSDEEIAELMKKCEAYCAVERTDTTKMGDTEYIVKNAESYIMEEIDTYAHYKAVITDRYHGTILSLAAGTPVIIIKTTDHKVTTGAEWFKGIYDDYVYVAESLNHAFEIAKQILNKKLDYKLSPFFEENYYDKLPEIINNTIRKQANENM